MDDTNFVHLTFSLFHLFSALFESFGQQLGKW
jgi:hypothetical protein